MAHCNVNICVRRHVVLLKGVGHEERSCDSRALLDTAGVPLVTGRRAQIYKND
jgi:hypothetical protein